MKLWHPFRSSADDAITEQITKAAERNSAQALASWRVRRHVSAAVAAEQAELRRNHLGELLHVALSTPGRYDR